MARTARQAEQRYEAMVRKLTQIEEQVSAEIGRNAYVVDPNIDVENSFLADRSIVEGSMQDWDARYASAVDGAAYRLQGYGKNINEYFASPVF